MCLCVHTTYEVLFEMKKAPLAYLNQTRKKFDVEKNRYMMVVVRRLAAAAVCSRVVLLCGTFLTPHFLCMHEFLKINKPRSSKHQGALR